MTPRGRGPLLPVLRAKGGAVATIYDVARLAAVSPATVSRVINGRGNVDRAMASRVQHAIAVLDYRPNGAARSLRRQVTPVWALIISDIENPHFTALVRGVEDVAQTTAHSVVLCNSDEDLSKERRYVQVAIGERMAGVIISPASDKHTRLEPLLERHIPVVTIDREIGHQPALWAVLADNAGGAADATAHLLQSGYRQVACITGPSHTSTGRQRLLGYRRALASAGVAYEPSLVRLSNYKEAGGYSAMRSLLDADILPDAVFVANSLMTMGALQCLADARVAIPDQLGVVGFDDHPWARLLRPALSTVAQPTYELGRSAARMLAELQDDDGAEPRTLTLPTRLVIRESSIR